MYPDTRTSNSAALTLKHYLPWRAAVSGEYRFFHDTWGIVAHTFEVDYTQPWHNFIFDASLRYYHQNAATSTATCSRARTTRTSWRATASSPPSTDYTIGVGWGLPVPALLLGALGEQEHLQLPLAHLMIDYSDFRNALLAPSTARATSRSTSSNANVFTLVRLDLVLSARAALLPRPPVRAAARAPRRVALQLSSRSFVGRTRRKVSAGGDSSRRGSSHAHPHFRRSPSSPASCWLRALARRHAQAREEGRLLIASEVLEELRDTRDQSIPDRLLERAYAIAVIPDLTKVAFFAGGRHGHGVLVVRDSKGRFSNPAFVSMTGGSFGWQWGVQNDRYRAGVHHRPRASRGSPAASSPSARMPRWPQARWGARPRRRPTRTSRPRSTPTRAAAAPSRALRWTARSSPSMTTRTQRSTRSPTSAPRTSSPAR